MSDYEKQLREKYNLGNLNYQEESSWDGPINNMNLMQEGFPKNLFMANRSTSLSEEKHWSVTNQDHSESDDPSNNRISESGKGKRMKKKYSNLQVKTKSLYNTQLLNGHPNISKKKI